MSGGVFGEKQNNNNKYERFCVSMGVSMLLKDRR